MSRSAAKRQTGVRKQLASNPELLQVCRQLALLALAQQDGPLGPRQREELRRALAIAGDQLGWAETPDSDEDPVVNISLDVVTLATGGAESLERDLAEEWKLKQTEAARLGEAVKRARQVALSPKTTYPTELTYSYTVRDPYQRLITKIATNTVNDAQELTSAADALEKSIESRSKLADLMVIDLDQRRERLNAIGGSLPDFVRSARSLLGEVIATLT
jgi:hypothetical protein